VTEPIDYDGAWKETLERYLRPFLELCFPLAAAGIDWAVAIEFLDYLQAAGPGRGTWVSGQKRQSGCGGDCSSLGGTSHGWRPEGAA